MRITAALILLLAHAVAGLAAVRPLGLKAAMDKGLVRVAASATGDVYHGKALRLQLVNNTRDVLQLTVEPALVFRPDDTAYQDLVLPGSETLTLAPERPGELIVQTFCGKALARGPKANLAYTFRRQGDSVMIRVLQHIRKHRLFDELGQHAVWALTDEHKLDAVIDPARPGESSDLLALMVHLTGFPTPDYFKVYKLNTVGGQPVFEKRVLNIVAKLEWALEAPSTLSLGIFNEAGAEVQTVFKHRQLARGGYRMQVAFEAEGAPPGKYYMRLTNGDTRMREIVVEVE